MQVYSNERESWGFWSLRFRCGGLSALGLVRSDSFMFVLWELGCRAFRIGLDWIFFLLFSVGENKMIGKVFLGNFVGGFFRLILRNMLFFLSVCSVEWNRVL